MDIGYRILDARYRMRDAGCWMLDARYGMRGSALSNIASLPLSLSAPCLPPAFAGELRGRLRRGLLVVQGKKTKKLPLPSQGQAVRSDLSRRIGRVASEEVAPTELTQKRAVCYKQVAPTELARSVPGLLQTGRPYGAGEAEWWVMTRSDIPHR